MVTSRTLALLFAAVLLGAAGIAETGCAIDAGDDALGEAAGELGASPTAAGIRAGSLEEEGVLLLVNDRAVTLDILKVRTKVTASVANSIIAFRTTPEGAPQWFSTIDEIDALPATGTVTFQRLVADANASGYTEAPGFDPPTLARISVPDNLGRPPTASDVVVEAGFDGKPAAEAAALVRARLTNTVAEAHEDFVNQTIKDNHKAFTLAVGNLFARNSPHATFAQSLAADSLTVLGTMSAVKPTILVAEKSGTKTYYARGASGGYEPIFVPSYPVIMRAKIRLATAAVDDPGDGVRIFYPAWSAKAVGGPSTDAGSRADAGGGGNDAGPSGGDAGPGIHDAGSVADAANDAAPGPGIPSGTSPSPVDEGPVQEGSTSDPMAEPKGEGRSSKSGGEALVPTKKSSGDSGGCAATPRGAGDSSWAAAALVLGTIAFRSLRRRQEGGVFRRS